MSAPRFHWLKIAATYILAEKRIAASHAKRTGIKLMKVWNRHASIVVTELKFLLRSWEVAKPDMRSVVVLWQEERLR